VLKWNVQLASNRKNIPPTPTKNKKQKKTKTMTHHNEANGQLIHWNKQQMQWKEGKLL
jgi:hypothetical protein